MENLSLTDGYPVQPVPWRQSVNARDAGGLKSQFMRSAKLPVRGGIANSAQVRKWPVAPVRRAGNAEGIARGVTAYKWRRLLSAAESLL
jgi:hypothetical protein